MKNTQKVTVLDATYNPITDEVIWQVELKNGDRYPLVWKKAEFSKFIGIRGDIPLSMLEEFFNNIRGKENVTVIIKELDK